MHDARALIAKSWKPPYSTGLFNHTRGEPAEGEGGLVLAPFPMPVSQRFGKELASRSASYAACKAKPLRATLPRDREAVQRGRVRGVKAWLR
jgi:hypothetical protein